MILNPVLKQMAKEFAANRAPQLDKALRLVRKHMTKNENSVRNRFESHFTSCRLPQVSVLSKMTVYDRNFVIALYRFRLAAEISDILSGYEDCGGEANSALKSLRARLKRLEATAKAFSEFE